jgi:hypothetical protein
MATTDDFIATLLGEQARSFLRTLEPIQKNLAAYRMVLSGLKSGEIKLDHVQIMEDGGFRVLPGEPADPKDSCVQAPSPPTPNDNGKKHDSELVTTNDTTKK